MPASVVLTPWILGCWWVNDLVLQSPKSSMIRKNGQETFEAGIFGVAATYTF